MKTGWLHDYSLMKALKLLRLTRLWLRPNCLSFLLVRIFHSPSIHYRSAMNLSSPTHSCCRSLCGQALITFLLILAAGISLANDTETFFENEVRPILHNRCIECHGPEKQKAGLRLDSLASALSGGDSGPALVQSDPKSSLIIQAIHYQDPDMEMPPKQKL